MINYYQILGVSETVEHVEIKKAYRTLAKKYHPDRNTSEDASQKFIQIEEAYSCLINMRSRKIYDQLLQDLRNGQRRKVQTKKEEHFKRNRKKARAQAQYHAKMNYQQYQKDQRLRNSIWGRMLKWSMTLITGILLFTLYYKTLHWIFGADSRTWDKDGFFGMTVFLMMCVSIISLVSLSFLYESLVIKWLVGKPKRRTTSSVS